jgi:hypothetical protein
MKAPGRVAKALEQKTTIVTLFNEQDNGRALNDPGGAEKVVHWT